MILESPSLLITDDDLDFRDTLCSAFQSQGFRTLAASDGEEALQIVQQEQVHLLLLDHHMPRLTGLETIRRLRALDSPAPCILISAAVDDTIRQEAQRSNAFTVLAKPISFPDVTSAVHRALKLIYNWP